MIIFFTTRTTKSPAQQLGTQRLMQPEHQFIPYCLVLRLIICGVSPPGPNTLSWHGTKYTMYMVIFTFTSVHNTGFQNAVAASVISDCVNHNEGCNITSDKATGKRLDDQRHKTCPEGLCQTFRIISNGCWGKEGQHMKLPFIFYRQVKHINMYNFICTATIHIHTA